MAVMTMIQLVEMIRLSMMMVMVKQMVRVQIDRIAAAAAAVVARRVCGASRIGWNRCRVGRVWRATA